MRLAVNRGCARGAETPVDVPQLGEQRARARRSAPRGPPREGEGDLGARPELAHQVQLLGGEVVEAVEEDRPGLPSRRVASARPRVAAAASEWSSWRPSSSRSSRRPGRARRSPPRTGQPPRPGSGSPGRCRPPGARRAALPAPSEARCAARSAPAAQARRATRPRLRAAGAGWRSSWGPRRAGRAARPGRRGGRRCRRARRPPACPPVSAPARSARRRPPWARPGSARGQRRAEAVQDLARAPGVRGPTISSAAPSHRSQHRSVLGSGYAAQTARKCG